MINADTTAVLAFARHHRVRRWLKGRVFALVQSDLVDAFGRILGCHVTPILVELNTPLSGGRSACVALWREIERRAPGMPDPGRDEWASDSRRHYARFRETRTRRERAIWQAVAATGAEPLQPGLFDHRTLRDHRAWSQFHEQAIEEAARRVDISQHLAAPRVTEPRVVLLLVSRRV